jgi:hypothetical protein
MEALWVSLWPYLAGRVIAASIPMFEISDLDRIPAKKPRDDGVEEISQEDPMAFPTTKAAA